MGVAADFFNLIFIELLAKVRNLPFDKLRVNGLRLKLFSFSVRGELVEPQKKTFARASIVAIINQRPLYNTDMGCLRNRLPR